MDRALAGIRVLQETAQPERLDATVAQIAIAWVLHQPGVAAAIAGSRSDGHTHENADAAGVELSEDVLEELEELIPLGPAFA